VWNKDGRGSGQRKRNLGYLVSNNAVRAGRNGEGGKNSWRDWGGGGGGGGGVAQNKKSGGEVYSSARCLACASNLKTHFSLQRSPHLRKKPTLSNKKTTKKKKKGVTIPTIDCHLKSYLSTKEKSRRELPGTWTEMPRELRRKREPSTAEDQAVEQYEEAKTTRKKAGNSEQHLGRVAAGWGRGFTKRVWDEQHVVRRRRGPRGRGTKEKKSCRLRRTDSREKESTRKITSGAGNGPRRAGAKTSVRRCVVGDEKKQDGAKEKLARGKLEERESRRRLIYTGRKGLLKAPWSRRGMGK